VQNDAGRSAMDNVTRADPDRVWTVREVAEHVGIGGAGPVVVGTPEQVADKIEQWFEDTDVDGLNVAFAISPGDFEDIADMLVPELVKRGRYKREYAKGTREAVRRRACQARRCASSEPLSCEADRRGGVVPRVG
jgi:long-chain alkane monooxygenase